jgi:catechol 2,3-dioxygenase-like lactoylglutathione lyase family enzyme
MDKRHVRAVVCALALASSTPTFAQLAPPNDLGVTLGHIHLAVKDLEAHRAFWTTMLGGTLVTNGPLTLIQFPGIFIMLRQADAAAPAAGSVVDHFGLVYQDIAAARARWKAAGVKYDVGAINPDQGYVHSADGAYRVEVFGDPSLPGPVGMDHIHLYPSAADIPAMQAWYAKVFGGFPGQRKRVAGPGTIEVDYFHRFNVSFSAAPAVAGGPAKPAPSRGRAVDHIGFDVPDLDEFEKKLSAQGVKLDAPVRQVQNGRTRVAFFTDPWGTYIEVTENLAP